MTDVQQMLLRARAFIVLIVVLVIFAFIAPNFLSGANMQIMAKHVALNAILGIGMTFVILTGGIDLSVGSIVGLTAMMAGLLINNGIQLPMFGVIVYPATWLILVIVLIIGTLMGAISGWIITRFNVAPFIATLGMLYVARGLALLSNNGYTFANLVGRPELKNTGFAELGAGSMLGVNWSIWIMLLFAVVATFVATRTPFGRRVYALGGNERAAELSGVTAASVRPRWGSSSLRNWWLRTRPRVNRLSSTRLRRWCWVGHHFRVGVAALAALSSARSSSAFWAMASS